MKIEEAKKLAELLTRQAHVLNLGLAMFDLKAFFPDIKWSVIWGQPGTEARIKASEHK
jgi:hypothetical protein